MTRGGLSGAVVKATDQPVASKDLNYLTSKRLKRYLKNTDSASSKEWLYDDGSIPRPDIY